jgi:hypothetical protein
MPGIKSLSQFNSHTLGDVKNSQYIVAFIIIFASIRGAFVFHYGLPPNTVYVISSMMMLYFGFISFRLMLLRKEYVQLSLLRSAIKINAMLMGFYTFLYILIKDLNYFAIAYAFLMFPTIFVLMKYDERLLGGMVYLITLVTISGVLYFYNLGINGGFEAIEAANLTLRPGELAYSRIGDNLLPVGYQGDHHDAANILVMCSVFLLSKSILLKNKLTKYLHFVAFLMALFVTILTGSAANIIVLLAVTCITLIIYVKHYPFLTLLIALCAILLLSQFINNYSDYLYFYEKASYKQSDLEGGGMFNALNFDSVVSSVHSIVFGFGYIFNVPLIKSEIGFVKQLVQFGLFSFVVFMFICFSPLYYISRFTRVHKRRIKVLIFKHISANLLVRFSRDFRRQKYCLIITAMPSLAGILTMLHYGSLFRITSVGLFCVLLAIFYKQYIGITNDLEERYINYLS